MSIQQVARAAGVSTATVSRVINQREGVSRSSAKLVREAMAQLGYEPSPHRRGPRPRQADGLRTRNIALLMVDRNPALLHLPIVTVLLHGMQAGLAEHQLNLIVAEVGQSGPLPPSVMNGQVDGVVLLGPSVPAEWSAKLSELPAVWLLTRWGAKDAWGDRVQPDNPAIGCLAAEYLLGQGHRETAYLNLVPGHPAFQMREAAFREAVTRAGGSVVTLAHEKTCYPVLTNNKHNLEVINALADQFLACSPRPSAMFLPADWAVPSVCRVLEQRGLTPQRDVLMVSCDNDRPGSVEIEPRPATIDIGAEAIGRRAVEQLLWRIRHGADEPQVCVSVAPTLIDPR